MMPFLKFCGRALCSKTLSIAAVVLLALAGCKSWETHDEGFRDNDMAETVRKARPSKQEKEIDYWSFDERGRQIERNLAGQ